MHYKPHLELEGRHSFLSPSNHHWVNYDLEKLEKRWITHRAALRGSQMHAFAHQAIQLRVRQIDNSNTINAYINDAIGFRMQTEQPLYYSDNCFGTADAISFRDNFLRIHDLKTGSHTSSMRQLVIYAALFCLEYNHRPGDITVELRIYQNREVSVYEPTLDELAHVIFQIVTFDNHIQKMKAEGLL